MNTWDFFMRHPLMIQWGWVLVHFLWQGALLALFAAIVLASTASTSARWRYRLATICLLISVVFPFVTWMRLSITTQKFVPDGVGSSRSSTQRMAYDSPQRLASKTRESSTGTRSSAELLQPATEEGDSRLQNVQSLAHSLDRWLPWCVAVWFIGVLISSIRLGGAWLLTARIIRTGTCLRDHYLRRMLPFLNQLGCSRPIRWIESHQVRVPQAIGWLRPVILVPTSLFTSLTPQELESLLLHELVHVRRYDFLVNLLQCAIETVFFYHPGILWLSQRVRLERELACDDEVVRLTGDKLTFSRALLSLADVSRLGQPALAASESDLTTRIHTILGRQRTRALPSIYFLASLAACLIFLGIAWVERHDDEHLHTVEFFTVNGETVPDVSGQVVDSSNQPIAGASVYLRHVRSRFTLDHQTTDSVDLARVISDDNGEFEFTQVRDPAAKNFGTAYDIVAMKGGYAIGWKHVVAQQPIGKVRVELKSPVGLPGKVVNATGQPVPGALVRLKCLMSLRHITQADLEEGRGPRGDDNRFVVIHGFRASPSVTTDSLGRFAMPGLVEGSGVVLEVVHPEFLIKQAYAATLPKLDADIVTQSKREVQAGEISVQMEPGYRLRVKVRDAETGELVPRVRYATTHTQYFVPPKDISDNGVIELNHLRAPEYSVMIFPPENTPFLAYRQRVTWSSNAAPHELEVALRKGVAVRGRVTSQETGKGIPGVSVSALSREAQHDQGAPRQYAASPVVTDVEGNWTVFAPPGEHEFRAQGRVPGFQVGRDTGEAWQKIHVSDIPPTDVIQIVLSSAPRFRLVVTNPDGLPAAGVSVQARAHVSLDNYFPIDGQTDEQGAYMLSDLFSSASTFQTLMDEEVVLRDTTNRLGAQLTLKRPRIDDPIEQQLDVRLVPLGTAAGRVVLSDSGAPVAGAQVVLYKSNYQQNGSSAVGKMVTTGPDGRFELQGVLPGVQHSVWLQHRNYRTPNSIELGFTVTANGQHDFGDIRIDSLTPANTSELAQVTAPDTSGLSPEDSCARLESQYKFDYQAYRDELDRLTKNYSAEDVVARREPTPVYGRAFLRLAQADPGSEVSLKSCLWIVNAAQIAGSERQTVEIISAATKILQEHFLSRPEMENCIAAAIAAFLEQKDRRQAERQPELLAEAAEKLMQVNSHPAVHARACFHLVERFMPNLWDRDFSHSEDSSTLRELCRKYLNRVKDEFAEFDHFYYGTYGKAAERYLFDLDHMLVGQTPPNLDGTDVSEKPVKLSDYRGKLVIVDFWQGFGPATHDHEGLKHILARAGDRVAVLGIVSSPVAEVKAWAEKLNLSYPVIADGKQGPLFTQWNIHMWPTTFLLDEQGVILHRGHRGTTLENKLLEKLAGTGEKSSR